MSKTNEAEAYKVVSVRLDQISPSKFNPRKTFDEGKLDELAKNIKERGGVDQAILLRPNGKTSGKIYDIVFGERRFRASLKAGLTEIRAEIREMSDEEAMETSITENLMRVDIGKIEEAEAIRDLMELKGCTILEISKRFGKSETAIRETLSLNKLHKGLKNMLSKGAIETSVGMVIARWPEDIQKEIYEKHYKKNCAYADWSGESTTRVAQMISNAYSTDLCSRCFNKDACAKCPNNSKNRELDLGLGDGSMCLKRECLEKKTVDHIVKKALELLNEPGVVGLCHNRWNSCNDAVARLKGMGHEVKDREAAKMPSLPASQSSEKKEENEKIQKSLKECKVVNEMLESGRARKYVVIGMYDAYLGYVVTNSAQRNLSNSEYLEGKYVRNQELRQEKTGDDVFELLKGMEFTIPWNKKEEEIFFMSLLDNMPYWSYDKFDKKIANFRHTDDLKKLEIARNLTPDQKVKVMREFCVKQFEGCERKGKKGMIMMDLARLHFPDGVAAVEKKHNDYYEPRDKRLKERIAAAKAEEAAKKKAKKKEFSKQEAVKPEKETAKKAKVKEAVAAS